MTDDNKLRFESCDYYAPSMRLEIDCSMSSVTFRMKGTGDGVTAELDYSLLMVEQVEKVIDHLIAWRQRERERTGR